MNGGEWFVVVLVGMVVLAYTHVVSWRSGRTAGVEDERKRLWAATPHAKATVNEDGRLVNVWDADYAHGQERGEYLGEIPNGHTRAASRNYARAILEAQGEEGASVAEDVLTKFRSRERKVT